MKENCLICMNCCRTIEERNDGVLAGYISCAVPGMVPKLVWQPDDYCPCFIKQGSQVK